MIATSIEQSKKLLELGLDPTGANKKMVINYRRYKGEKLNTV